MLTKWMKKTGVVVLIMAFGLGLGMVLAEIAEMTKDEIIISTPEKKSDGVATFVKFAHKNHVDQYGAKCETCHPAIDPVINSPKNNQVDVHATCRQCHAKNKPGKTFACDRCHIK
ncbi:MAG: cytochrome c3 family protein [bacterium]